MIDREFFTYTGPIQGALRRGLFYKLLAFLALPLLYLYLSERMAALLSQGKDVFSYHFEGLVPILVLALALLARTFLMDQSRKAFASLVITLKHRLRQALLTRAFDQDEALPTAKVIALASDGVEHLDAYFTRYYSQFYYCLLSSVLLLLIYWQILPLLAVLLFILSLTVPFLLYMALPHIAKVQRNYWDSYTDLGKLFLDSLRGMTTLLIYRADEQRNEEINEKAESFRKKTMKLLAAQLNSLTFIDWIAYGGAVLGILMSIHAYSKGSLSLSATLFSLLMVSQFFLPMQELSSAFHVAMTGASTGRQILDYLSSAQDKAPLSLPYPKGEALKIQDLSFTYQDGTRALEHVTLTLPSQGLVGLVGPSGCGKSTLASLLSRQAHGTIEGSIAFASADLDAIESKAFRASVCLVRQHAHLFMDSVKHNLKMAKPDATDQELIAVLKAVDLWSLFAERQGLDSLLEDRHANLSGGQAQRLAMARALLVDTSIYIFDEVTANIDQGSEAILLSIMARLSQDKLVINISHRLDSLASAQEIFVFEKGCLVQSGPFSALVQEEACFKRLYDEQAALLAYTKEAPHV